MAEGARASHRCGPSACASCPVTGSSRAQALRTVWARRMLPLGDDNSDRRSTPIVAWVLIAANVLVFVLFQGLGSNQTFTYAFATVPAEILSGKDLVTDDRSPRTPSPGTSSGCRGCSPRREASTSPS